MTLTDVRPVARRAAVATAVPTTSARTSPVPEAARGVDTVGPRPFAYELWPLALALVGYPVWWLLGVAAFAPILSVLPMIGQLWVRRDRLRLPPAFGWWMLFIVWVLISAASLRADALGAVPGSGGLNRVAVYLYRLGWYVSCTVVLVWATNLRARATFARAANLVGWLFVFCVVGGIVGLIIPRVVIPSFVELLLPTNVAANGFVKSLVHPGLADIQYVLGRPEPRPKAPFAFANTWGSVFSLTLPFFWFGWLMQGHRWQRWVAPFVLAAGAVPMVLSLNRGLWVSLIAGALIMVVLQAVRGRSTSLILVLLGGFAAVVALVVSPLGNIVVERLQHGHSNERRSLLLQATVASASEGSPIIGFGSTRDVQGNFASIAGGSTADCAACGVPPLGTQGHIWLVIFSNGLVGAVLFVLFFALALLRFLRCRGPAETVATLLLVFFGLQLFVYDTLGLPLFLVMLAVGLATRSRRGRNGLLLPPPTFREGLASLRPLVPVAAVLGAVGMVTGLAWAGLTPQTWTASERIALTPVPTALGQAAGVKPTPPSTIDTEAGLLLSDAVLSASTGPGETIAQLRDRVTVTAPELTSIMVVKVTATSPGAAQTTLDEISRAYLAARAASLEERRTQTLDRLNARAAELSGLVLPAEASPDQDTNLPPRTRRTPTLIDDLQTLGRTIEQVTVTPVEAGQVVRTDAPTADDRQLGKLGGSGLAVGVLAGLIIGLLRRVPARRYERTAIGRAVRTEVER